MPKHNEICHVHHALEHLPRVKMHLRAKTPSSCASYWCAGIVSIAAAPEPDKVKVEHHDVVPSEDFKKKKEKDPSGYDVTGGEQNSEKKKKKKKKKKKGGDVVALETTEVEKSVKKKNTEAQ